MTGLGLNLQNQPENDRTKSNKDIPLKGDALQYLVVGKLQRHAEGAIFASGHQVAKHCALSFLWSHNPTPFNPQ